MNKLNATQSSSPTITKTIYLIRHGVAQHNIHDPQTGARPDYHDPKLTDPPLIRQGELQARVLSENLRRGGVVTAAAADRGGGTVKNDDAMDVDDGDKDDSIESCNSKQAIELVVCSPLTRCLQTASLIFPSYFQSSANTADSRQPSPTKVGDCMYILSRDCRVFCHEDVREAFGMHYPDRRR